MEDIEVKERLKSIAIWEYFDVMASSLDEVPSGIDLEEVGSALDTAGVSLCPFHAESTPSFRYYVGTNTCYCFGCGTGGDIISLHMKLTGANYKDTLEYLRRVFLEGDTQEYEIVKRDEQEIDKTIGEFNVGVLNRLTEETRGLGEALGTLVNIGKIKGIEAVEYYRSRENKNR